MSRNSPSHRYDESFGDGDGASSGVCLPQVDPNRKQVSGNPQRTFENAFDQWRLETTQKRKVGNQIRQRNKNAIKQIQEH
jgi:hypothetical protein